MFTPYHVSDLKCHFFASSLFTELTPPKKTTTKKQFDHPKKKSRTNQTKKIIGPLQKKNRQTTKKNVFWTPPPQTIFLLNFEQKNLAPCFNFFLESQEKKNCISATIGIGQEIQCLPYAGFFCNKVLELVHRGSVINWANPIFLYSISFSKMEY